MGSLHSYFEEKSIPTELATKIQKYYKHLYSRQGGSLVNDQQILSELPVPLRTEINLFINGDICKKKKNKS